MGVCAKNFPANNEVGELAVSVGETTRSGLLRAWVKY